MDTKGGFTLPGEAGYEKLTLELAKRWGADVIRDSDGTKLSDEILRSGCDIYSTLCIIREHNPWAQKNMDKLQQTFLITAPMVATETCLTIPLMEGFFEEQLAVNDAVDAMAYWQVYDRTSGTCLEQSQWTYDKASQSVTLQNVTPWHKYTVSFLAYRLWEAISMYNHTTNNWDKEHLMPIDPMYEATQDYLLDYMEKWCQDHEATNVVRFTSMFYNFVWMWGSSDKNRHLFTDWGSYDFTVSLRALEKFEEIFGYKMTAEDFVNGGKFNVSHMPRNQKKKDWMTFINDFVVSFGGKLIDIVHKHGKKAYVFYDDSWVGIEPYGHKFEDFGFDGMIKCVFSGYEARLCAGVKADVHELRLHPYLFPVGLGGAPTFMEGGDPARDATNYWIGIRRALLREGVDRIGLGGYLHLTEDFPEFVDTIEGITEEFRSIKALHKKGKPYTIKQKVAVLHAWGHLRSWTLSGHFHETDSHDLIHVNEALAGLPVDVDFIDFDDVKNGALNRYDVVINAGFACSAWSGGYHWQEDTCIEKLTEWVHRGGLFIGIGEPSAVEGYDTFFRMAHVLGVDKDKGERVSHGRWTVETNKDYPRLIEAAGVALLDELPLSKDVYLTDGLAKVVKGDERGLGLTINGFGEGAGVYLSSFRYNHQGVRLLFELIGLIGEEEAPYFVTNNIKTECAYYPESGILVLINNSDEKQDLEVAMPKGLVSYELEPYQIKFAER